MWCNGIGSKLITALSEFKDVSFLKTIKAKFLLLALSLFYDAAFMNHLWADPQLRRTAIGMLGLFIMGITGVLYATSGLLFGAAPSLVADALMLIGLSMFLAGSWRGRMSLAFDLNVSQNVLSSTGTVICNLSDAKQSSAYIEGLMSNSQTFSGENSLNVTECYLIFASEIWIESLEKKGLNLLGELLTNQKLGELIASKNHLPSV
jgi:hypothetical protein